MLNGFGIYASAIIAADRQESLRRSAEAYRLSRGPSRLLRWSRRRPAGAVAPALVVAIVDAAA